MVGFAAEMLGLPLMSCLLHEACAIFKLQALLWMGHVHRPAVTQTLARPAFLCSKSVPVQRTAAVSIAAAAPAAAGTLPAAAISR